MGVPVLIEGEIWKPVTGFENYYMISSYGRLLSLRSGQLRKQIPNRKTGYLMCFLCGDGLKKCKTIHRLVADAFCEKPFGCNQVNHRDENKHNNRADNLEWVTKLYNNKYNGKDQRCCKKVEQLDENYNVICIWDSERKASRALNVEYKNISAVCRGLRPRAGGYRWRFASNE